MKRVEINVEDLKAWLEGQSVTYASETRVGHRLRLNCMLTGGFTVEHNGVILYTGTDADEAVRIYNNEA